MRSNPSSSSNTTMTPPGQGWLEGIKAQNLPKGHELWSLPEEMTDPFTGLRSRLQATLDSFRFKVDPRQPRLLLDWAIRQTRLDDPLSHYTRHDLEQAFPRFVRDRDRHLHQLVQQAKKEARLEIVREVAANPQLPADARTALERALRG